MNIWENLQIYKHKTQNKLVPEQIEINTKHDTIFKALNIENTQNTNTYTTITHNNTNLKYQKPTGSHNNNSQPTTHMSVSYTHLDVYKRQTITCFYWFCVLCLYICKFSQMFIMVLCVCLLYTSRCV